MDDETSEGWTGSCFKKGGKKLITLTPICMQCNTQQNIEVTEEQLRNYNGGTHIQDAMPNLTPGQREILISGTCEKCFNKIFSL
ncbi:hypothetical protein ACTHQ4_02245 [Alkalicoccobacillus gibsonii]|uniref:hypothetical protein n=1 Tax=Alkalicoccobacillus gibsonii TaxID=79881 RepID=UPI003F7B74CD